MGVVVSISRPCSGDVLAPTMLYALHVQLTSYILLLKQIFYNGSIIIVGSCTNVYILFNQ
jgi:hypothetical protein